MELTLDEVIKNMLLFVNLAIKFVYYHMNMDGLVLVVDIT